MLTSSGSLPVCRVVRFRSLGEELGSSCKHQVLRQALSAEDTATNATLYILMRAVDRFYDSHKRFPGTFDRCVAASTFPMCTQPILICRLCLVSCIATSPETSSNCFAVFAALPGRHTPDIKSLSQICIHFVEALAGHCACGNMFV